MMAVDEKGRLVDGDKVMAICALDMKERGLLKKDVLVGTVMSNLGLELGMKEHGIKLVKTDVGDRYVLEEMLKSGYNLGGEQSGHIIFLDHNTTGRRYSHRNTAFGRDEAQGRETGQTGKGCHDPAAGARKCACVGGKRSMNMLLTM